MTLVQLITECVVSSIYTNATAASGDDYRVNAVTCLVAHNL